MVDISDSVTSAWDEVLDDNTETNWMLAGYSENGKSVEMKSKGTGGFTEFKDTLAGMSEITYGGFRCIAVDDRGNTVSKRAKFITVTTVPEGTPVMKKARVGTHSGAVLQAIHGGHVALRLDSVDELDQASLESQLLAAGGSHKPTSFEF